MSLPFMHALPGIVNILIVLILLLVIRQPNRSQTTASVLAIIIALGEICYAVFYAQNIPSIFPGLMVVYNILVVCLMVTYHIHVNETYEFGAVFRKSDIVWIGTMVAFVLYITLEILFVVRSNPNELTDFNANVARCQPCALEAPSLNYLIFSYIYRFFIIVSTVAWAGKLIWGIRKNMRYHRLMRDFFVNDHEFNIAWNYLGTALTITMLLMLIFGELAQFFPSATALDYIYLATKWVMVVISSVLIYNFSLLMPRILAKLKEMGDNPEMALQYIPQATITPEQEEEIDKRFRRVIEQKFFLQDNINLFHLANAMDVDITHLRAYLRKRQYDNFPDLVRQQRDRAAKR